ncbi:unnamed protein product [Prorocentrum cordatum]|uniref:Cellulase n=1 Tax=Prorocentrum cordatum TaxID=2364126 RepID=A0ABN9QIN7_9DINO|nr:unnamed protein product [Polarella glacialis]
MRTPHSNSAIWCFEDPTCPGQGCVEDSGCRYCDASAIGGPSYDGEACPSTQSFGAALAADEGCTADAKPCAAPHSNSALWCFEDPTCPGQGCVEDSGCRYCDASAIGGPSYDGEACPSPAPSSGCTVDAKPCAAPHSNSAIWCFEDPTCPGQGCVEDSGCRYCDASAIGGPSYDGEACPSLAPSSGCTVDAKPCAAPHSNSAIWCFEDPTCPGQGCVEDSGCRYAMPRRSAGLHTMVRRAHLPLLSVPHWPPTRAALRTRSLAQPRIPTRLSGASRTQPAQGKGASRTRAAGICDASAIGGPSYDGEACPSTQSLGAALAADEGCTADAKPCAAPHSNSALWCFEDPTCPGQGCVEDSGCRYCDASAIGGPSYDGEACPSTQSLGAALAADEGCTADAKPCAAPHSNSALWCFEDPTCPGQGCVEDSGCRYCDASAIGGPSYDGEACPSPAPSSGCTVDAKPCAAPHSNSAIWCFEDPTCPGQGCVEDSGCRYCDASAIGGPSYDGEACPSIQSLGAALAADEGCDGMTYTRNYAEGTPHECRCDSYCDDFCDDEPNGCARTCRILNGVFEHIPSVHAGDRTCTWYAHYVTNPIDYEGYDCSWMTGTGEGGHGDDCQDGTSVGALKCREGNQNQNNCHF